MISPFPKFESWYKDVLKKSTAQIPSACCLSTIGLDGYPNARFVSLKSLSDEKFIVTGPISSRKGIEIEQFPKASLVFWWAETEQQVRIQGNAAPLENEIADRYFKNRNRDAQLVSIIADQGKEIEDQGELLENFERTKQEYDGKNIHRPSNWGGFKIDPIRIEFLEFRSTRLHERQLFLKNSNDWTTRLLQP